jgi:hypothetical protein
MTTHTKKRFYVYGSWEEQFEILTTEEKATMLMNLFKYSRGIEPILDTTGLKLVWAGMKFLLEQDDTKYQAAVQRAKNTKPQKQLMEPQKQLMAPQIELLNHTDNDNVNDNVNVNEDENEEANANETMRDSKTSDNIITPPTFHVSGSGRIQYTKRFIDDFWDND